MPLTRQVPVYFTYVTAWAGGVRRPHLGRPDIYGRDGVRDANVAERDPGDAPPARFTLAP